MKVKNVLIGSAVGMVFAAGAGAALYFKNRKTIPDGANAVTPFDIKKYLGKWYEIARLDFYFEKGLDNAIAEYSLNEDGSVKVVNKGFNVKKNKKEKSIGKAKFVDSPNEAKLKVSFAGPFYAGYNVIAIDKAYQYALVAGRNLNYLWILSRETSIPDDIKDAYLQKAKKLGYKTENLIWCDHKNQEETE